MAGSIFGKHFSISTWGESHGRALGVIVDGCPAGINICPDHIQENLNRRRPGVYTINTPRQEDDSVEILSGVFDGKTTGTPISLIIYNRDERSRDYDNIKDIYRPGHADLAYDLKYGFRDYRGGGRSSGRETAARVAAGAIAKKVLTEFNIDIDAYTYSIGDICIDRNLIDRSIVYENAVRMPDIEASKRAEDLIDSVRREGDSIGGIIECNINSLPAGLGEPVFDKLEAVLAKAIMSIGATRGIEFGEGFNISKMRGSMANDNYRIDEDGTMKKTTNYSSGIGGGISDGFPIQFRVAFKPTPSISIDQDTITGDMENANVKIHGRHDPCIVPRAVPVVEAMTAIVLLDLLLQHCVSNIDLIRRCLL